jgi:arabinan endo-1,5-alpha-L-arabinosidase
MSLAFEVEARDEGEGFRIRVRASSGVAKSYFVPADTQQEFTAFYLELAADFGTRLPHMLAASEHPAPSIEWRPLLTENVHPRILAGYGDPAVLKAGDGWWLVATSNDAPDAFPILHSTDLQHWDPRGFVFP